MPDIREPVPDAGHEQLRLSLVAALDDLADHVEQLADSFLLAQTAGDALGIALTNVLAVQQAVTDLAGQVGAVQQVVTEQGATLTAQQTALVDLTARVTALEPPPTPEPPLDPTPAA